MTPIHADVPSTPLISSSSANSSSEASNRKRGRFEISHDEDEKPPQKRSLRSDPRRLGDSNDAIELLMGARDQLERTGKVKRCLKLINGILFSRTYIRSDQDIKSLKNDLANLGNPPDVGDLIDYIDGAIEYFSPETEADELEKTSGLQDLV